MSFKKREGKFVSKRKFFEDREGAVQPKVQKLDVEEEEEELPDVPLINSSGREMWGGVDMSEEAMLEKLVLGDLSSMLERLGEDNDSYPRFNLDSDDSGVEDSNSPDEEPKPTSSARVPAWNDEEDSNICIQDAIQKLNKKSKFNFPGQATDAYSGVLKNNFCNLVGTPNWAKLDHKVSSHSYDDDDDDDDEDDDDNDNEILRHANKFLSKTSMKLPREEINIKRVLNLNHETKCEGNIVTSVEFHPKSTVALVAGLSGTASIVQVDGEHNKKLHTVQFSGFPINTAKFTASGDQFFAGSRFSFFYRYDLIEGRSLKITPQTSSTVTNFKNFQISPDGQHIAVVGRFGNIYLLNVRTNEFISTFKMNGEVSTIAFDADGSKLFSYGDSGEVYVWDISSRTCLFRFFDEGCVSGSAIAISPNGQFLATGSSHGVVNIYETSSLVKECNSPKPAKVLYNLTTSITSLSFNPSSEILSMISNYKDNAVRLVHFPSMTVFKNFPLAHKIQRAQVSAFSIQSGYYSVTNNKQGALLFRLKHYGNY